LRVLASTMQIEIKVRDETNRTNIQQTVDIIGGPKYGLELQFYESEHHPGKFSLNMDAGYQCQVSLLMNSDEVEELRKVLKDGHDCS